MDRSLEDVIADRQRTSTRGSRRPGPPAPRRGNYDFPRDGVRKPRRDERANLDDDWVHDRYDDERPPRGAVPPSRSRRDDRHDRDLVEEDRGPPAAKIRVENLHYDLTEDNIYELFERIAPVLDVKLRYDRAGRSDGVAFVTYESVKDARTAIKEFDGANAKGQPIRLALLPPPDRPARRDNPFDKVENPRSLFDRIEAPNSRERRRRSASPMDEVEEDRRGAPRRGGGRGYERRTDTTRPPPENIDRYIPGERSDSRRGGRRPGERRERQERPARRDGEGPKVVGGRPRKTAEELDAEMDDYWGDAKPENGHITETHAAANAGAPAAAAADDDIDMIE